MERQDQAWGCPNWRQWRVSWSLVTGIPPSCKSGCSSMCHLIGMHLGQRGTHAQKKFQTQVPFDNTSSIFLLCPFVAACICWISCLKELRFVKEGQDLWRHVPGMFSRSLESSGGEITLGHKASRHVSAGHSPPTCPVAQTTNKNED